MHLHRRSFMAGSAAALAVPALLTRRARAAEFTMRMATTLPPDHPTNVRLNEAAAAILEETGGRVEILVFPAGQLGSPQDLLSQVRSGALDFYPMSSLILSTLVPAAAIVGIGFAFSDYDSVWKTMDGPLGLHLRDQINATGTLVAMDRMWDSGFRQTTTTRVEIKSPADMRGLKLRIPAAPIWTSMFTALGAAPTAVDINELYSALQTGIVDGQENPLPIVQGFRLYEVQKFGSMTNHMWDGFLVLANKSLYERLPEDLRAVVAKHIDASALKQREDVAAADAAGRADLESKGMTFSDVDPDAFRAELSSAGFYESWKSSLGEEIWTLLEDSVGKLA